MKKMWLSLLALIMVLSFAAGCTPAATEVSEEPAATEAAAEQPEAAATEEVAEETEEVVATEEPAAEVRDSLVIGVSAPPDNYFNWMDSQSPIVTLVVNATYDSLMRWETTFGEMQPCLATSYEVSEDGTVITYHLRDDVYFHNGDKFVSADVSATYELLKNNPWQMAVWDYIDHIETPDDTTVVFYLTQKVLAYPWTLSAYKIMPSSVIASEGQEYLDRNPIGTGPYKFVSYTDGVSVELVANPDYFGGEPPITNVRIDIIPDENTLATAMENGDIDYTDIKAAMLPIISGLEGVTITHGPTVRLSYMQLNTETLSLELRKAIAYATDRAYMLEVASNGAGTYEGTIPFNSNVSGFTSEGVADYSYDLDMARSILEEAGIQTPMDIGVIRGYESARIRKEAEILQADLASIGLNAEIEISEFGAFETEVLAGNFAIAIQGASYGDILSGYSSIYESRYIGETNYARYNNPTIDELFEQAIAAPDLDTYNEICAQIIQIVQEDVPYVMLYEMDVLDAHDSDLNIVVHLENNNYISEFSWNQ